MTKAWAIFTFLLQMISGIFVIGLTSGGSVLSVFMKYLHIHHLGWAAAILLALAVMTAVRWTMVYASSWLDDFMAVNQGLGKSDEEKQVMQKTQTRDRLVRQLKAVGLETSVSNVDSTSIYIQKKSWDALACRVGNTTGSKITVVLQERVMWLISKVAAKHTYQWQPSQDEAGSSSSRNMILVPMSKKTEGSQMFWQRLGLNILGTCNALGNALMSMSYFVITIGHLVQLFSGNSRHFFQNRRLVIALLMLAFFVGFTSSMGTTRKRAVSVYLAMFSALSKKSQGSSQVNSKKTRSIWEYLLKNRWMIVCAGVALAALTTASSVIFFIYGALHMRMGIGDGAMSLYQMLKKPHWMLAISHRFDIMLAVITGSFAAITVIPLYYKSIVNNLEGIVLARALKNPVSYLGLINLFVILPAGAAALMIAFQTHHLFRPVMGMTALPLVVMISLAAFWARYTLFQDTGAQMACAVSSFCGEPVTCEKLESEKYSRSHSDSTKPSTGKFKFSV